MATDSEEIIRVFRSYNKEKGWPMAHEAADLIEKYQRRLKSIDDVLSSTGINIDEILGPL
jgi:hypothetical protein